MSGKARPSLRAKTLANVERSNLSITDKKCITEIFERYGDSEQVANDIVQKIKRERNSVLEEFVNRSLKLKLAIRPYVLTAKLRAVNGMGNSRLRRKL